MTDWLKALEVVAAEALELAGDDLADDDLAVLAHIGHCVGAVNARTSRALAEGLGWDGPSDDIRVRHTVERLVRVGLPVCSSRRRGRCGYYIPADEEELLAGIAPIRSEAAERFARADALDTARVKIRLELDGYSARLTIPRKLRPEPAAQLSLV